MKNICIKASVLALLFAGASFLTSCGKKTDEPKPTPPNKKEEVKPTPAPQEGELPEITKVTFRIGESHLHSKKGIHYVPNSAKTEFPLLAIEQKITYVKEGNTWKLASGSPDRLIGIQMVSYGHYTTSAPEYALWVTYYDANGKEVNAAYADAKVRNQYQLFMTPSDVKAFDGDDAIDFSVDKTPDILHYEYCDTDPWNKSFQWSAKHDPEDKRVKWLSDNDPVGMKGYFQFKKISHFNLHFALWHAPKGKLEGGNPAPFYAPNKQFTEGGKKLFDVVLPIYVCGDRGFTDEVKPGYGEAAMPYDQLSPDSKKAADRLMKALNTTEWIKVATDLFNLYKGGGAESGGEEY